MRQFSLDYDEKLLEEALLKHVFSLSSTQLKLVRLLNT